MTHPAPQDAQAISQAQNAIVESVDAVAEAARRRQEIGYAIDQNPGQTTAQSH